MSPITTHILDTSVGRPAANIPVALEFFEANGGFKEIGAGLSNADGRIPDLLSMGYPLQKGTYRITFTLQKYFLAQSRPAFYPVATVVFEIDNTSQHYHIPLLLGGYGYTTYRGS